MNIKKIEYIITDFITPHIKESYPLYVEFLTKFGKYLDQNNYRKIMYLEDNFDPYTTFSELLDLYIDKFFTEIFDTDIYGLTDSNKERFIDLSVRFNKIKGCPQTFQSLLQSLINFTYATSSGNVNIDNVGILTITEPDIPSKIFQYNIQSTSQNIFYIDELKQSIHPAGMLQTEFIDYSIKFGFFDDPTAFGFGSLDDPTVGGYFERL